MKLPQIPFKVISYFLYNFLEFKRSYQVYVRFQLKNIAEDEWQPCWEQVPGVQRWQNIEDKRAGAEARRIPEIVLRDTKLD